MEAVRHYEIWWADLPKPVGRRPVLLLSRDDAHGVLNKFVAAEITATVRHIPIEVPLGVAEGMAKACVVNCDNLRTISKLHLVKKISRISTRRIADFEMGGRLRTSVGRIDWGDGVRLILAAARRFPADRVAYRKSHEDCNMRSPTTRRSKSGH